MHLSNCFIPPLTLPTPNQATHPVRTRHYNVIAKLSSINHPRLIVLPGMDGTDLLLDAFRKPFNTPDDPNRVIAVTYPRHEKLTVHQLANHISQTYLSPLSQDPRGYILINQSFSGHVGLQLARRTQPGSCKGQVFVNTFVEPPGPSWLPAFQLPDSLFHFQPPSWLISPIFLGPGASGMDVVQKAGLAVSPHVMNHRLTICLSHNSTHLWTRKDILPGPSTLYLRGSHDSIVGDNAVDKLRNLRPDITWVHIPHGPHLLLQQCGEQCAAAVDQFCTKLHQCA